MAIEQDKKYRNRPEEDLSTRRTAEEELMRGDRGTGESGGGSSGGSGTAGQGVENEGTGSLLVNDADAKVRDEEPGAGGGEAHGGEAARDAGSGSTKGGREPGVSGKRGMTGGLEKEGEGHSGPIRSGSKRDDPPDTEQDRAADGDEDTNAREGYEDHGGSRDDDGTRGESSGSRPGYR